MQIHIRRGFMIVRLCYPCIILSFIAFTSLRSQEFLKAGGSNVIREKVCDTCAADSVRILLTRGSESSPAILAMEPGDSNIYSVTVPDSLITETGLSYMIEVLDSSGNLTTLHGPNGKFLNMELGSISIKVDTGRWHMISVPYHMQENSLNHIAREFGKMDSRYWRACRYVESSGSFLDYSPERAWDVLPGRAFWLFTRKGGRIHTGPVTLDSLNDFTDTLRIRLSPGWNQVGLPFPFSVSTARTLLDSAVPVFWHVSYTANGNYEHIPVNQLSDTTLFPWRGYWVANRGSTAVDLRILPKNPRRSKSLDGEPEWLARLSLLTERGNDTHNYLSFKKNAPPCSLKGPPAIAPGPGLDLGRVPARAAYYYIQDEYPWYGQGKSYTLRISGCDNREPCCVSFNTIKGLSPFTDFAIYDGSARKIFINESVVELDNNNLSSPRTLKLLLGDREYFTGEIKKIKDRVPGNLIIGPAHPNPMRSAAGMNYSIPSWAGNTLAHFRVLNIRGELVRSVVKSVHSPGKYCAGWNACDQRGSAVAPGTYIFHGILRTQQGICYSKEFKIVLIK
jgi:hypothetical protein